MELLLYHFIYASFALMLVVCLQYPFLPNTPKTASVQLGFLPLNHLMGRMTLLKCLITGGQVCCRHLSCCAAHPGCAMYIMHPPLQSISAYKCSIVLEMSDLQMTYTPADLLRCVVILQQCLPSLVSSAQPQRRRHPALHEMYWHMLGPDA